MGVRKRTSTFYGKLKVKFATGFLEQCPQMVEDAKGEVQPWYADLVIYNFTCLHKVYIVERNVEKCFSYDVVMMFCHF